MMAACMAGLFMATPLQAQEAAEVQAEQAAEEKVDAKGIVLDHIRDSYEWHITTWGETHVTIPLPVILHSSETGWHVFSSARLHEGDGTYEGFHIAHEGDYEGKIVERTASGAEVRPFDLSITKTVLGLLINSTLVVALILYTSRWYARRKPEDEAPRGLVGMMEMLIMSIENEVIKTCVGPDYKRYSPYLLTAFFFIFINNLMGLIPIFPGGANVTGNIAVTAVLALCTMIAVNVFGTKAYWRETLWPDVPTWLKAPIPLMPAIELFGVFTKPFALMIRLFANIMAGHSVILALTSVIFVTATMGAAVSTSMTAVSVLFCIFMNCVEVLVAFIQAYVFTMLSAVFIGLSRVKEHEA
jgi:F-type H+-transporting ATPase subunit a